jgi:hypothetical protein
MVQSVTSSVQQKIVQDNINSVHGSQTTELKNSLEHRDWRVFIVNHLKDLSRTGDRRIRRQALKYSLLYRRTIDNLHLKYLDCS